MKKIKEKIKNKVKKIKETKDKKRWIYFYFANPTQKEYALSDFGDSRLEFSINNAKVRIYNDKDDLVRILRIDVDVFDDDKTPNYIKNTIQSVLKLTYAKDFLFSKFVVRANLSDDSNSDIKNFRVKLRYTLPKRPLFDEELIKGTINLFRKKPTQLDLLASNLDLQSNHIEKYCNLYKIIEFEYHLFNERDAKTILKKNISFKKILSKYKYQDKSVDEFIDYIVDLRDKCSHLKKIGYKEAFGFSPSNIEHQRELSDLLPLMAKICAQVINPNFEIIEI